MHERPTILVPIRVLEGESFPEGTAELLSNVRVLLLGYHVVPEQTAPGQMRMQFETKANNRLEELESLLESAGATVETRLVFTRDGQKTIDRMVYEHGCLAVLDPEAVGDLDDVLVPIRGTVGVDRIARVVTGLFADTDAGVTRTPGRCSRGSPLGSRRAGSTAGGWRSPSDTAAARARRSPTTPVPSTSS